jgi:hypothetical protein
MSAFDMAYRPQAASFGSSGAPPAEDQRKNRPPDRYAPKLEEESEDRGRPEDIAASMGMGEYAGGSDIPRELRDRVGFVFDHDGGYTYKITAEGWFEIVAAPDDRGVGCELTPDGEFADAWQTLADYVEELGPVDEPRKPGKKPRREDPWRTGPKPGEGKQPKGPTDDPEKPTEEEPEDKKPGRSPGGGLPFTVGGYPSSRKPGPNQFKGGEVPGGNLPVPLEDGNEKITPPIARACAHLAEYLPASTRLTSGWRTHEEQADLIVDFADAGGLIDGDLSKTYDVASSKKDIAWVGDSAHQSGLAFDLSGGSLSAIEAAVKQCMEDHPEDGIIDTLLESANNCVHVEVRG